LGALNEFSQWKLNRVIIALTLLFISSGCAHVQNTGDNASSDVAVLPKGNPKSINEVLLQDREKTKPGINLVSANSSAVSAHETEIVVQGIKLKNTHFDFPITINSRVEYWIDYFCGRGRGYFTKYLERSEFFIPYITPLLKQNNMPEDLVYLAMIESGFNNLARSRAKAVGPWQFISATGKRYGLMVNWWIDERRDIRKSTLAAVEYLRDLYTIFQSWELAAASYNAGEAKIARGVRRFGSKDFWVLSKHRFLRPETRDYVPKIIAAAIIAKNRTQFGFPETGLKPGEGEAVAPDGELVKVIKTDKPEPDSEYDQEKEADHQRLSGIAQLNNDEVALALADDADGAQEKDTPNKISLQQGAPSAPQLVSDVSSAPMARPVPTPHVTKKGEVGGEELTEYDVQSPADLLKVARAAGLSYQTVKNLNPEILRWCTPPTLSAYRIKLPASVKDRFLTTYNHVAYPRKVQFMTYKVHRGETLTRIAQHFGIRVDPISDLNGVSPRVALRTGLQVLLPMPNDRSRNLASLEIKDPPERKRGRKSRHRTQRYYRINYKHRESARNLPVSVSSQESNPLEG
jgi:hypothetical protein